MPFGSKEVFQINQRSGGLPAIQSSGLIKTIQDITDSKITLEPVLSARKRSKNPLDDLAISLKAGIPKDGVPLFMDQHEGESSAPDGMGSGLVGKSSKHIETDLQKIISKRKSL